MSPTMDVLSYRRSHQTLPAHLFFQITCLAVSSRTYSLPIMGNHILTDHNDCIIESYMNGRSGTMSYVDWICHVNILTT